MKNQGSQNDGYISATCVNKLNIKLILNLRFYFIASNKKTDRQIETFPMLADLN